MNCHVGSGAADVYFGCIEGRGAQGHVGIVGEAEALFRNSDEVPIQLVIAVLVMNSGDGVIAWGNVRPDGHRGAGGRINRRGPVAKGLVQVFRPAFGRGEDDRAQITFGVAESVDMNAKRAA